MAEPKIDVAFSVDNKDSIKALRRLRRAIIKVRIYLWVKTQYKKLKDMFK